MKIDSNKKPKGPARTGASLRAGPPAPVPDFYWQIALFGDTYEWIHVEVWKLARQPRTPGRDLKTRELAVRLAQLKREWLRFTGQ